MLHGFTPLTKPGKKCDNAPRRRRRLCWVVQRQSSLIGREKKNLKFGQPNQRYLKNKSGTVFLLQDHPPSLVSRVSLQTFTADRIVRADTSASGSQDRGGVRVTGSRAGCDDDVSGSATPIDGRQRRPGGLGRRYGTDVGLKRF